MSSAIKKTETIKIILEDDIKTPYDQHANYTYTSPNLYLEFLENKEKVQKDKRNQNYHVPAISKDYLQTTILPTITGEETHDISQTVSTQSFKRKRDDDDEYSDDEEQTKRYRSSATPSTHLQRLNDLETGNYTPPNHPQQPKTLEQLQMEKIASMNILNSEKREYLAKFNMIQKQYPRATIPHLSMQTDLEFMKNEYDSVLQRLRIDDKHQRYRQYMTMLFYGAEVFLGKFFKLDMVGYAEQQIQNMDKYDKLLIELCHKNYIPDASEKFPVEVRLLGLVVIQTAVFLIMKKVSINMDMSFFNMFSSPSPTSQTKPTPTQGTTKMSGPSSFAKSSQQQNEQASQEDSKKTPT